MCDFGYGVLPGALAGATHHHQVAVAHLDRDRRRCRRAAAADAAYAGRPARRSPPSCPWSCRGRWCRRATRRCRGRRGSSSTPQCGTARRARGGSDRTARRAPRRARVRQLLADHVGVHQAGHVDDPLYICRRSARHGTSRTITSKASSASGARCGGRRPRRPASAVSAGSRRSRRTRLSGAATSDVWKSIPPEGTPGSNRCSTTR